ncbi:MAG: hypothetical protein ACD_69C00117G0002, partial [uncultured bacterium]
AAALAVSSFITVLTILSTIFYAVSILISHQRGEKTPAEIGRIVKNGIWLAILLSIPGSCIVWHLDKILLLFKQDPYLVTLTHQYFHFAAFAVIPLLINTVIAQFYTGIGRPRFTFIVAMIMLPIIILFSYGLVLGNFGLPRLELAGVIAANFFVQFVVMFCIIIYMYLSGTLEKYQVFSNGIGLDWQLCKSIFTLGLPIGVQFGAELGSMAVATYFMGYFGVTALAASQIATQYSMLVVMIILGLSQAISVLTSESYGKKALNITPEYIYAGMGVLSIAFAVIFLLFFGMPEMLIHLYVGTNKFMDKELITLTSIFLAIAAVTLFIDGIRNLLSGALRGLHESQAPMRIGVICLWLVSLPCCYFVAFYLHGGPIGLRLGFMSGFILAVILLWLRLREKLIAV